MGAPWLPPLPWRDHAAALASAATWLYHASCRDPWLIALAAAHTSLLTLVIAARDSQPLQLAVLAACFGVVRGGDAINRALATRWRSFASRDFFDERGAFFAAAVAGPLLGVMCVQLILQLRAAWRLMVRVKVAEVKLQRRAARRKAE